MSAERPGPQSSYWMASGPSTLPAGPFRDWLHHGLGNGFISPDMLKGLFPQQPGAEQPTFPIPAAPQGGNLSLNLLGRPQQAQPQAQLLNALAAGRGSP